jgi:hypothetical protein
MSLEQELRGTSDSLLRALDLMTDLESQKRELPTGSPQFVELARRIEELAVDILYRTERQASLAETLEERRDAGGGTGRSIEEIPSEPRDMALILRDWRAAERALADGDPATLAASTAAADVRRLREEYRLAHELLQAKSRRDDGN